MSTSSKAVRLANRATSVRLGSLVSTTYEVSSRAYSVQVLHAKELKPNQKEAIWTLFETNMRDFYQASPNFGWDPQAKRKELYDSLSRFILVTEDDTNKLLAFTNFRFEVEEDEDIIYCYDLQVAPSAQGTGFGKKLLQELEKICRSHNMEKIMLTVFKTNIKALGFYQKLGFELDPTSPDFPGDEEPDLTVDYQILSKTISDTSSL